ncbi:HlyIII-domain-containing protein [Choiromyces venosus 120613-1]|uniref:HlyIII-domain-containing protein n=1 Tax=Choiromyces venosus 120613-1 TaxID=1336337 RepID=A0A3N4J3V3_9PEZI|nr:HlyIII-domain-containing protein [Choiromyces venosus 120613-1]
MEVKSRNKQRDTAAGGSVGEMVVEAAKNAEKKVEQALTVLFHELPLWMQDNHFIISGYRPQSFSLYKSFHSLTYLHNETVNIYTHLLPSLLSLLLGTYALKTHLLPRYPTSTTPDLLSFTCFFASAGICLGLSATYHTLSNHSPRVASFGNKLDYLGIVILIMGSFIPSVHYAFYCHRKLAYIYWLMISLLGAGCATVSVMPAFRTPAWRPFRAGMFVGMGLSSVLPVLHGVRIYGFEGLHVRMGVWWMLLEGGLYVFGAGVYAARVPERFAPGRFDLLGSSHQVFHCLVVAAAGSHLVGLVKAFDYLHGRNAQVCG